MLRTLRFWAKLTYDRDKPQGCSTDLGRPYFAFILKRGYAVKTIDFAFPFFLAFVALIDSAASAQEVPSREGWEKAEREIKRLPPSAFRELPPGIREQLEARGCTIPQTAEIEKPHSVIHGEFAKKGQTDWAGLCSRDGKSSILVFWGGPAKCPSELARGDDRHSLQTWSGSRIAYSRAIQVAGKKYILDHYNWYGGPKPPPLDHQGIDDAFIGKASVVRYCHQGRWLELQGAD